MLTRIFTSTKCFPVCNQPSQRAVTSSIGIGGVNNRKNALYLYVPFEELSSMAYINRAQLVLYCLRCSLDRNEPIKLRIRTTNQFLNPHAAYNFMAPDYCSYHFDFLIPNYQPVITLDVTQLVTGWINLSIENTGLLVELLNYRGNIVLAGNEDCMTTPFIHLRYSLVGELPPAYISSGMPLTAVAELKE